MIIIISLLNNCVIFLHISAGLNTLRVLLLLISPYNLSFKKNNIPKILTWFLPQPGAPEPLYLPYQWTSMGGFVILPLQLTYYRYWYILFEFMHIGLYMRKRQLYILLLCNLTYFTHLSECSATIQDSRTNFVPSWTRWNWKHISSQSLTEINLTNSY